MRVSERSLYPVLVTERPVKADIIRRHLMNLLLTGIGRRAGPGYCRQHVIVHIHELRRIPCFGFTLCNHDSNMITYVVNLTLCKGRMSRRTVGLTVIAGNRHAAN